MMSSLHYNFKNVPSVFKFIVERKFRDIQRRIQDSGQPDILGKFPQNLI